MNNKPNCYECKNRHDLIGDYHSECRVGGGVLAALLLGCSPKGSPRFNPHGIKNGWAFWPFNFDPIWLEACPYFQGKEEQHEQPVQPVPVSEPAEAPVPERAESVPVANTTTTSK
jgi:hypothetical protein